MPNQKKLKRQISNKALKSNIKPIGIDNVARNEILYSIDAEDGAAEKQHIFHLVTTKRKAVH